MPPVSRSEKADRISIKDIAKAAGVSHSTVSRALGDSPLVNAETKARIQKLAQQMGYSPDARARRLVTGRTDTLGVVVTTIADPFVAEVVQGIESTAHTHGYTVILATSNSEPAREMAAVEMLRSERVDGVIVTSSRIGALYPEHLEGIGAAVVLINNHNEQSGRYTYSVTVDNRHGGHLAARYLIEQGHRRIAYITGPADHSDDADRLAGCCQAMEEAGLHFDPAWVVPGDGRASGGEQALDRLAGRPTAVFCYNDMTAIGLLRAAHKAGLRVPEDMAVVGFDDIPFARYVRPPLTTVAQPKMAMGRLAVEMALNLMASDDAVVSDVVVKGELVVRESA